MSKIVIASFLLPGGWGVLFVQNYQKYFKNYFLLGQPYSEADRSSNARSELKTIKDNFLFFT